MSSNKPLTNKLTFKSAREIVKSYGGRLTKTRLGDYKLVFGQEEYFQEEYFTDSLVDVVGTAKAIWMTNRVIQSFAAMFAATGKFNG